MDLPSPLLAVTAAAALCLGPPAVAQSANCDDLSPLDTTLQSLVTNGGTVGLPGATMSISRNGKVIHESDVGPVDRNTVFRVASASKWIAGAVICSLVEDGLLDLNTPVVQYLPGFTGDKASITVRQLFSHTSGLVSDHPAIVSPTLTLAQAADLIATTPLNFAPGSEWEYGNVGMHVGARVAEIAAGQNWLTLFQDRIAGPLNMVSTDYGGLPNPSNPLIAAGMRSTRNEFSRFLQMLVDGGVYNGRVVLGPVALDLMLQDQTNGAIARTFGSSPGSGSRYGIGCFIDAFDENGDPIRFSSPGAFGSDPWIDLERNTAGIVLIESIRTVTEPFTDQIRAQTRSIVQYRGVECLGNGNTTCLGAMDLRVDLIPKSGLLSLPIRTVQAPPMTIGAALIGASSYTNPLEILSAQILVSLGRNTTGLPAVTDPNGQARFDLPFGAARPGDRFVLQFVFPETTTCGTLGNWVASDGLAITVQ